MILSGGALRAQSTNLSQSANGPTTAPVSPTTWQNGNLNGNQAHFEEGHSIPYRQVLTSLPVGVPIRLTMEFDATKSSHVALDFITSYNRIEPHGQFGHPTEIINPLQEVTGTFGSPSTFPIPPLPQGPSAVAGQPTLSYNNVAANGEMNMTIWNGTITNLTYSDFNDIPSVVNWNNLSVDQSVKFTITFVASSPNVVIAWGGHIASGSDWGDLSCASISGSPFHTSQIQWTFGSLGSTDRALAASAVTPLGACMVNCPTDITVSCQNFNSGIYTFPVPTYTCVNFPTVTTTFTETTSGNCPKIITRNYVITVYSHVIAPVVHNCSARVLVVDDTPPSFTSIPQNIILNCNTQIPVTNATATDNCGSATVTKSDSSVPGNCAGTTIITRTFTAIDNCGNVRTATQTITLRDTIAPVLSGVPVNTTIQCGQPLPTATVAATDNCDPSPMISLNAITISSPCGYSLVRTWTATDECGNTSTGSQTTTFIDTIPPMLINTPLGGTVSCGMIPDGEDFAIGATDNCNGDITITSSYIDQANACNISRIITWNATDACGNTSTVSRTFTSNDTSAPVIVGLPNASTIACGSLPSGDDFEVYANDNCDSSVSIQYTKSDAHIGCNVSRSITWTATDNCGNVSTATRTFTSIDAIAPVLFGIPNASTIQCGQPVPNAVVSATDNCDNSPIISMTAQTISNTCGASLVRTWTAIDACGNVSSASQTTTFIDTTPPQLGNLPDGGAVNCMNLPTANDFAVTATDNCQLSLAVISSLNDVGTGCNKTRTITWSASDACGNATTLSRIFTASDLISPVLNNLPQNATVVCGSLPSPTTFSVSASDNCDSNATVSSTFSDVGIGCNMARTITWTATDNCGNTSSMSRTFSTEDLIAPVMHNVPSDMVLECGQPVPAAVVTATDNCDLYLIVALSANTVASNCGYALVRTWTVTDVCGNSSNSTQTTTFIDNTPPALQGLPMNATVSCGNIPEADDFDVTATDNCTGEIIITSSVTNAESACNITRVITWTVTDACGNMATSSRTFISMDNSSPVFAGLPANATVACGALPTGDDFEVYANDNCDPSVQLQFTHEDIASGCNVMRMITWTAIDNCGNTTSASRIFTSADIINPTLTGVPQNATLECGQPVPDALVSATDNCDASPMVSMSANTIPSSCGYSLIRTWTATDECGNTSSASQTTTFVDTTPPTLGNLPDAASIACGEIPTAHNYNVTATDNCIGEIVITSTISDSGVGCNMTRTITWTATDACGNVSSVSRMFSTSDNSAPLISGLPTNITLACGSLPEGDSLTVIAIDNCDPTVNIQFTQSDDFSGCNKTRTIIWTASDGCGNSTTETRIFTSNDTIAPMLIGVPQNASMQCGEPVPDAVVSAMDNCDTEPMVSLTATTVGLNCGSTLVRTWTATDACGNSSTVSQTTTFVDTTPPVLQNLPTNATVVCLHLPEVEEYNVTATDNCPGEITLTSSHHDSGVGCALTRTITWNATDACGNSVSASRNFSVSDMTPPAFVNLPVGGETPCGSMPNGNTLGVTASDDCNPSAEMTTSYVDTGNGCYLTRTITWTATDLCGNVSIASRTFISVDLTAPVLYGLPQNATMAYGGPVPNSTVVAGDNCDENMEVALIATTIQLECGSLFARTWSVTDMCGNTTTATRTITYMDDLAPTLHNVPEEGTFGCSELPDEETFNVTATDDSDGDIEVNTSSHDFGIGCGMFRTITWTATDHCGNVATLSRTFLLSTNEPPILTDVPQNISLPYSQIPAVPDVTATDQCGNSITVIFSEVVGIGCPYTIVRSWTATDGCGNETAATQVVTLFDYTPPIIVGNFEDITLQCHETIPQPEVTANDNCDPNVTITLSSQTQPNACGAMITKTWVATDICGNSASATLQIYLVDETSPVFAAQPENITVNCGSIPPAPILTAADNCTANVNIEYSETNLGGGCPYLIKRIWIAYDDCGNSTYATQIVTVNDNISPVFDAFPQLIQMECGQTSSYVPSVTDNCTSNVVVLLVNEITLPSECEHNLQRIYIATDECGNSTTAIQLIELIDTTPPVLLNVPGAMAIQCGQSLPVIPTNIIATDNCTPDLNVVFSQTFSSRACPYNIVRQWTVTDNCGNTTTQTQTIHVINPIRPRAYVSAQPNPAVSGQLRIKFSTPYDAHVLLSVFDASGREVLKLMNGSALGAYVYEWTDELQGLSSGTYFLKISVDGETQNKMISILDR